MENNEVTEQKEDNELRIVQTENPEKQIWTMLSYFESEHNAKDYLFKMLPKNRSSMEISELAKNLAVDMQVSKEYYKAAQEVSLLTKPLLVYYGMVNLAKVLHIAKKGEEPEGKKHGLVSAKPWNGVLTDLSVKIKQYGIFPEFYHCYSNEDVDASSFSLKQLLSQVPEAKVAFETVYKEKSLALKVSRGKYGIVIVDSEFEKYLKLDELLAKVPALLQRYDSVQMSDNYAFLFLKNPNIKDQVTRTLSGEEYLVLPVVFADGTYKTLPELSTHFLLMFILGMTARYHPKAWAEAIKGQESGDIYVIQNFLDITIRKFPNLVLNQLRQREFFFSTPRIETDNLLTDQQLEQAYEFATRKMTDDLNRSASIS